MKVFIINLILLAIDYVPKRTREFIPAITLQNSQDQKCNVLKNHGVCNATRRAYGAATAYKKAGNAKDGLAHFVEMFNSRIMEP